MTMHLPTIGAALPTHLLPTFRDWLLADQRDLELQDFAMPATLDGNWRQVVRDARTALDGYTGRLGIHGPYHNISLLGTDPKFRALIVERYLQTLEIAVALEATHIVIHSPFPFLGDPFLPHTPAHRLTDELDWVYAVLEHVVPQAEQGGCTLMIENTYDKHYTPLRTLVESFDSPAVRMSLDTGHAFIAHMLGGPTPDAWVDAAGPLLGHVHLQDTDGRADRHWVPGRGTISWQALFTALESLDVQPRLILEIRQHELIPQAMAWLTTQALAR